MPGHSEPVISFRDLAFDRPDLVLVGFIDRTWPAFERAVAAGLACERAAGAAGDAVDADAILAAAVAFRRARGLVSGDELRAWLAERGLSRDEWTACVRRSVLRERHAETLDLIPAHHPVSVGDVAEILIADAACDGILQRCATTLIGWAAAAHGLDASPPISESRLGRVAALATEVATSAAGRVLDLGSCDVPTRLRRLLGLQEAHERFVSQVSGDAALRGCLEEHRLVWLRFGCVELRFARHDAAREALMCLREDGLAPGEVARLARAELRETSILLQEAEPPLASLLVSARPGDVVGPLPDEAGTSRLLVIAERVPPSPRDPELCERARRELVRVALEPLVAGMVRWHGPL